MIYIEGVLDGLMYVFAALLAVALGWLFVHQWANDVTHDSQYCDRVSIYELTKNDEQPLGHRDYLGVCGDKKAGATPLQ